ncbi:MAG TPA: hypothetical protein VFJ14_02625 [Nocardioidaceae bacterium]|nr:hypothetical protein [Nocardioidaceae bacterium]
MLINNTRRPLARATAAGLLAVSVLGVAGCGEEDNATVEDIQEEVPPEDASLAYDGVFDSKFFNDVNQYEDEQVKLSTEVAGVMPDSEHAFTIGSGDVEPLLVVSTDQMSDLEAGSPVAVTGTVHTAFELSTVEENTGVDLQDELFDEFTNEIYIEASTIDTSVSAEDAEG